MSERLVVHVWLRRSFRIHDNPLLLKLDTLIQRHGACNVEVDVFRVVYDFDEIRDQDFQTFYLGGARRRKWIELGIAEFDSRLRATYGDVGASGAGLRTYSYGGVNSEKLGCSKSFLNFNEFTEELFASDRWNCNSSVLLFERVYTPLEMEEEKQLREWVENNPRQPCLRIESFCCFNLANDFFQMPASSNIHDGPLSYNPFVRKLEQIGISDPVEISLDEAMAKLNSSNSSGAEGSCIQPDMTDACFVVPPGEQAALHRLSEKLRCRQTQGWDPMTFSKPDTCAMSLLPSTTLLSPYLSAGFLSVRLFHKELVRMEAAHPDPSKPPQSLRGQLYWREFSHFLGFLFGRSFDGYHCCCLPRRAKSNEIVGHDSDLSWYEKFRAGKTGFDTVDAAVGQLRSDGWNHHILRHVMACFLTRGFCDVEWVTAQKLFEEFLLDYDWAINASQWQWLSVSFLFYQFNRTYHPTFFAKKHDKSGAFVRKYLDKEVLDARWNDARQRSDKHANATLKSRSEELIADLKRAYLKAGAGFLRHIQPNVISEWLRESPDFGRALESSVRKAKATPVFDPISYCADSYFSCSAENYRHPEPTCVAHERIITEQSAKKRNRWKKSYYQ